MPLLRSTPFRNFLIGSTISQLGDVFFVVALPWIVLGVSSSGIALGAILTALAIPRAALMLFGGAVSDRLAPRTILIAGNAILITCVSLLAAAAAMHALALWMLFAVAIVFGATDAFIGPAVKVLIPSMVAKEQIASANSLLQTATQLCLLAGAALAGLLMQRFGIVPALVIDACSFVFLVAALLSIDAPSVTRKPAANLLTAVRDGINYALREPSIRLLLIVIAAVNVCLTGATQVGIVALIHARFGSVVLYGTLVTVVAIGSLGGVAAAGALRPRYNVIAALLASGALLGVLIASLAVPIPILGVSAILFACGIVSGYVNILVVSALQTQVASDHLGRVMSIVTLSSIGLAPVSLCIAGFVAEINLNALFVACGGLLIAIACVGSTYTATRLQWPRWKPSNPEL